MARLNLLRRRRATSRAAVAAASPPSRTTGVKYFSKTYLRLGWPLAITLCALLLLMLAGRSLLLPVPTSSASNSAASSPTSPNDPNSFGSLASDYYAAYNGKRPKSVPARHLTPVRFGAIAARPVSASQSSPLPNPDMPVSADQTPGIMVSAPAAKPLPAFGIGSRSSSRQQSSTSRRTLAARHVTATGEMREHAQAQARQAELLNEFLVTEQKREDLALQDDANEIKRTIADEVRAAGLVDLEPLAPELPDAATQLEMTNLRLKLNPALHLAPGEREAARARLDQLEAELMERFQSRRSRRDQEIARLREQRPRQVQEKGLGQLNAQQQAALKRGAGERAQVAAPLRDQLHEDAAQSPLHVTLPATHLQGR